MATGSELLLTDDQHLELRAIAQSRCLPAGYVFRAKLILLLAEGASFSAIKQRLQTTAPAIIRWKQRFLQDGLDGLDTFPPWTNSPRTDTCSAGADLGRHAQEAERWFHALELPQTGGSASRQ
jgi:hypothetical protein